MCLLNTSLHQLASGVGHLTPLQYAVGVNCHAGKRAVADRSAAARAAARAAAHAADADALLALACKVWIESAFESISA